MPDDDYSNLAGHVEDLCSCRLFFNTGRIAREIEDLCSCRLFFNTRSLLLGIGRRAEREQTKGCDKQFIEFSGHMCL